MTRADFLRRAAALTPLDSDRQQPALPGAEAVRTTEEPTPAAFTLPAPDPNDFRLTNPAGAPIDAPSLFGDE